MCLSLGVLLSPPPSLTLREACPSSGPGQSAKTLCAHMDRARLEAGV